MKFSNLVSSAASLALFAGPGTVEGMVARSRQQHRESRSSQKGASSCNGVDNPQDPSVTLKSSLGTVHGKINPSAPCVRQFLGIPYGRPPLGELRFAPPRPALPFGDLDAKHLPPSCMQYLSKLPPSIYTQDVNEYNLQGLNSSSQAISEDCLTLSVWTPVLSASSRRNDAVKDELDNDFLEDDDETELNLDQEPLPVIIFIYGGSFTTGGQDVPYQDPTHWVQRSQKHIIVVFNYRLNIFGFPNAAGLPPGERNLGLLDQRLAVEWVRDNIGAFGGDPARITLWGQSAGAMSVGYYQYAYPRDPIVKGVIMDSGDELLSSPLFVDPGHRNFSFVAKRFGCGNGGEEEGTDAARRQVECMRGANVSAQAVEDFIQQHDEAWQMPFIFFAPQADEKTVFTPAEYKARSEKGEVAEIPTILGSNANDGVAFVWLHPEGVNQTMANAVTLGVFFCTAFMAAKNRLLAPNKSIPVYRYEYLGNITSVAPKPYLGAYHSSELPLLFGTFDDFRAGFNNQTVARQAEATSRAMQDAWLAFAASRGPEGLAGQSWPRYTGGDGQVRLFGMDGEAAQTGSEKVWEDMCPKMIESLG